MSIKTISLADEAQLSSIATTAKLTPYGKHTSTEMRVRIIELKSDRLLLPIVLHKDVGLANDGTLVTLSVAVDPSMYRHELVCESSGIRAGRNARTQENLFRHSGYRVFAEPSDGREPPGMRYQIDWKRGGPNALLKLLKNLQVPMTN